MLWSKAFGSAMSKSCNPQPGSRWMMDWLRVCAFCIRPPTSNFKVYILEGLKTFDSMWWYIGNSSCLEKSDPWPINPSSVNQKSHNLAVYLSGLRSCFSVLGKNKRPQMSHEKNPYYLPLYRLVDRNPYNGLLSSLGRFSSTVSFIAQPRFLSLLKWPFYGS